MREYSLLQLLTVGFYAEFWEIRPKFSLTFMKITEIMRHSFNNCDCRV